MSSSFRWSRAAAALTTAWLVVVPLISQAPEELQVVGADRARFMAMREALAQGLPYIPGELLVRFRSGSEFGQVAATLSVLRTRVAQENVRWIGDVLHLTGLDIPDPTSAAEDLARQPEVIYAQPNYISRLHAVPNDPEYVRQWHMRQINMPQAWDIDPPAGSGVVVAVIDSGLTTVQGTFTFRVWTGFQFGSFSVPFVRAADFDHSRVGVGVDMGPGPALRWQQPNGQPAIFDAGGHGTHVAGTIAQETNNSLGFAGVAHGATLLPIKVCFAPWDVQLAAGFLGVPGPPSADEAGCPTTAVVEGIRYAADNGAKVINLSVGSSFPQPAELDALTYAVQRGVFVAIAAGNEALEGNPTSYPAAYASQLNGVMAVGAVTPTQQRAPYSNHGSYVEIVAPGGSGSSGSPDRVWQVGPNQADLNLLLVAPAFNRYQTYSLQGTSMASPHVAGVAALLYGRGIRNPAAIEAALKRFARDLGPTGRDNEYGHGLLDARAALRGFGGAR